MKWRDMAEQAGLAKLLEGSVLSNEGWHVTRVQPHHFVQCHELAWIVHAQFKASEQRMWTHVTGSECLKWRLKELQKEQAEASWQL